MTTSFYTDQPVCIDLLCHTEESRTFAGESKSRLTVIVANGCDLIIRECFLCLLGCFHPHTVNRRYGIAPSERMDDGEHARPSLFAFVCIAIYLVLSDS